MTCVSRQNGQLHYQIFGEGPSILLAFHGFGQSKELFLEWSKKLTHRYTIYAFDIFYHGASVREYGKLSKKEWREWLADFINKEEISSFSVLGYSLGGRFAISSAIQFPEKTEELILIAPDGIFLTPWFKLATTPGIKLIFRYLMMNPGKMEWLMRVNDRFKMVNKYIVDFVRKEMGDHESRKRVYISWNYFKPMGYSTSALKKNLSAGSLKKRLIIGEKDHIIHPKKILPLINKIGNFKVDILPLKHHQLAKPDVADLLR